MTYRDPDEPFGLGDTVRVLGTVYGTVVRAAFSTFSEPEYLVSYVDGTGSPPETRMAAKRIVVRHRLQRPG